MYITLISICEILKRVAVKIIILLGSTHGVYAAASFTASVISWYWRNDLHIFTSYILYMNITCIAHCLSDGNSEISYCSCASVRRQILFKIQNTFKQTCVISFTAKRLRYLSINHSYVKDHFSWGHSNSSHFSETDLHMNIFMFKITFCMLFYSMLVPSR